MNIDDLIADLQSLPDSALDRVRGYVAALKENSVVEKSSEERFWDLIDLIDWEQETEEEMLQPLVNAISVLADEEIYAYDEVLSRKLSALDTPAHFEWYAKGALGASSDSFLYGRCEVVANGRAFYEEVVANPEKIPNDGWMQSLLHAHEVAYEKKHGKEYDYRTEVSYETMFSEAWGDRRISYT